MLENHCCFFCCGWGWPHQSINLCNSPPPSFLKSSRRAYEACRLHMTNDPAERSLPLASPSSSFDEKIINKGEDWSWNVTLFFFFSITLHRSEALFDLQYFYSISLPYMICKFFLKQTHKNQTVFLIPFWFCPFRSDLRCVWNNIPFPTSGLPGLYLTMVSVSLSLAYSPNLLLFCFGTQLVFSQYQPRGTRWQKFF